MSQLRPLASRIRRLNISHPRGAMAAARMLLVAKNLLPRGTFAKWCRTEFNWNARATRRLKELGENFLLNIGQIGLFSLSALYVFSKPSTPEKFRQIAIEEADSGKRISYSRALQICGIEKKKSVAVSAAANKSATPPVAVLVRLFQAISSGGTLTICVSTDSEEGDKIVSASLRTDDGLHNGRAIRSSIETAIVAVMGDEKVKRCAKCGIEKPPEAFSRKGQDERAAACKSCERKRVKEWKRKKKKKPTSAA